MPKRIFNGDKAWKSDKLRKLKDRSAAEYAWMYSIALADGTFEAAPERILSDAYSYARKGWTAKKINKLLQEFEEVGLLLKKKDTDGKVWGYWVGSESEMPTEKEGVKYKKGKRYLFDLPDIYPDNIQIISGPTPFLIEEGLVRLGKDRIGREETDQPRIRGQYKKGEFSWMNRKPERVYEQIVEIWSEIVGPGAVCKKPFNRGWSWFVDTCSAIEIDTFIPAFELWAQENADSAIDSPIGNFLRVMPKYTQMLSSPRKSKIQSEAVHQAAIKRDIEEGRKMAANDLTESDPHAESIDDLFARLGSK